MKQPNPFNSPQTPQDRLNQSRTRLRLAVFGALALCLLVLVPLLVQGCKREEPPAPPVDSGFPPLVTDTNLPPLDSAHTNVTLPPISFPPMTNPAIPPVAPITPEVPPVTPVAAGGEYTVAKGDSFYTIGQKHGVSIKAISEANPGVDSTKLKIGQKLILPAPTAAAPTATPGAPFADVASGDKTYTVKSGDTLTRIAKTQGATVKAIKAANNLTTDRIKVGQKLKIPGKAAAAAPLPVTEPAPTFVPPPAPETAPALPPLAAPR